jgi:hypothetical protein
VPAFSVNESKLTVAGRPPNPTSALLKTPSWIAVACVEPAPLKMLTQAVPSLYEPVNSLPVLASRSIPLLPVAGTTVLPLCGRRVAAMVGPAYPTPQHERAAEVVVVWFEQRPETQAVLLTNSCARGKATRDSCLDLLVLVETESVAKVEAAWERFAVGSDEIAELAAAGRWAEVHLDVVDGVFEVRPIEHELDWLEVEVGNALAYSVPLLVQDERLAQLRAEWLPFYDDELRAQRLSAASASCLGYLERIPWLLDRQLWFQALARLHGAFHWFLLALHVSRRTYPIAYDKWIHEQVVDNLGLPELYRCLPPLFEIARLESRELERKAADLRELAHAYLV